MTRALNSALIVTIERSPEGEVVVVTRDGDGTVARVGVTGASHREQRAPEDC
jgi:hypothetical protein